MANRGSFAHAAFQNGQRVINVESFNRRESNHDLLRGNVSLRIKRESVVNEGSVIKLEMANHSVLGGQ